MGELYELKSEMLVYRHVMGNPLGVVGAEAAVSQDVAAEQRAFLTRNEERFQHLPEWQKENISIHYQELQKIFDAPFLSKLWKGIKIVLFEMQPFEQAWILFSVIIPIMLLMRIEGAVLAAWILPMLVFFYAIVNQVDGKISLNSAEALFPSENQIVRDYLKKPLSANIMEQRQELMQGWKLYLVKEWTKDLSSSDPEIFKLQAEQGEFAFNIARIEASLNDPRLSPFQKKESWGILLLYFGWNLFFAGYVQRKMSRSHSLRLQEL